MIHGDVEEALDLRGVEIDKQRAVGAGRNQEIGDELGGNGDAGTIFAVLAGIAVVGHHHGDATGRGAPEGVHHNQQLHQVLIGGVTGGLNHEHVRAANIFKELKPDLAVRKAAKVGLHELHAEKLGDFIRERAVGRAGDDLEVLVFAELGRLLRLSRGLAGKRGP